MNSLSDRKSRRTWAVLIPVLLALLLPPAAPAAAAEVAVTVKFQAEVRGDQVLLRDVAEISGPDSALRNDLADVYLTKAPRPGESTIISLAYLEHRLRASGLPLDLVDWRLPEQVTVTRRHQAVTEAWVRQVVEEYLGTAEPYKSSEWELIYLRTGTLPNLPEGELGYRLSPNRATDPTRLSLDIYLTVDGRDEDRIKVSGRIDLKVEALVAARTLEKGHRLTPGDLRPAKLSLARLRSGAVADPEKAYGLTCRRPLTAGQPVLERDLYSEPVVKRGDLVTILAQAGPLKVTCTGQAQQDGAVGDQIKVVNTGSNKTVVARVLSPGTVEVQF
ncbi:MAG: flagellar basal body P-ring formation chaperone FlgA [Thermodesulfobacteriota bacterium]